MNRQRVNRIDVHKENYGEVWAISLDLNVDPDSDDERHRVRWGQWIPVDANPVQVASYLRHIADSIIYTSSVHGVFGISSIEMQKLAKGGACTLGFRPGQHALHAKGDILTFVSSDISSQPTLPPIKAKVLSVTELVGKVVFQVQAIP